MSYRVAFSFAHSAARPGASHGGRNEHGLSIAWTQRVVRLLGRGNGVVSFVATDHSLAGKVSSINAWDPDLAMEIHFNACGGCGARGAETLYYPGSRAGEVAASVVHRRIIDAASKDRGCKEGWYRQDHPGQVDYAGDEEGDERPLYFLQKTSCVALILEPEFIEQTALLGDLYQPMTRAIADGILDLAARERGE